jgi:hypothetical protein
MKFFTRLFAILAAVLTLGMGQPARALELAPYFHAWGPGTLMDAKRDAGLKGATIAFGITRGACVLDGDLLGRLPDARTFVDSGGTVLMSFGGAAGTYLEVACRDDNQLFGILDKLIQDYGIRRTDWDIEGHQLRDTDATARRARVLARLQAKYPDLFVSFSLPGWLLGLDSNSMNLLRTTIAAGVRVDRVNVMGQSFGYDPMVPATVAQSVIMTFRASVSQMMTLFPGKSQTQLHAMMGVTPMIGKNDDGKIFTLADAKTLADFVKANGVGLLSYWSFQRDRAQATPNGNLGQYSGVAQSQYQFLKTFQTADDGTAPTPVAAPAPAPGNAWIEGKQYATGAIVAYEGRQYIAKFDNPGYNPTISTFFWSQYAGPAPASACGATAWREGGQYAAGSIVTYGGGQYIAKFANPGYNPTISTYFWAAHNCGAVPAPVPAPAACSGSAWVQGRQYSAGSIVSYGGALYQAKHANPGYNPTISTYFWARYYC